MLLVRGFLETGHSCVSEGSNKWIVSADTWATEESIEQNFSKCMWVELTKVSTEGGIRTRGNSTEGPTRTGNCHSCCQMPKKARPNQQHVAFSEMAYWILNWNVKRTCEGPCTWMLPPQLAKSVWLAQQPWLSWFLWIWGSEVDCGGNEGEPLKQQPWTRSPKPKTWNHKLRDGVAELVGAHSGVCMSFIRNIVVSKNYVQFRLRNPLYEVTPAGFGDWDPLPRCWGRIGILRQGPAVKLEWISVRMLGYT